MKTINKILTIIIIFAIGCGISSCENEKNETKKNVFNGKPEIKFEYKTYDFGELTEGEQVECSFVFENTGKGILKIKDIEADCGCTVPEPEKKEILPGEKSKIKVTFDSYGFMNNVYKTITVKTNADTSNVKLTISAFIKNNNKLN